MAVKGPNDATSVMLQLWRGARVVIELAVPKVGAATSHSCAPLVADCAFQGWLPRDSGAYHGHRSVDWGCFEVGGNRVGCVCW